MPAALFVNALEIRVAQKPRRARKSCCLLWWHSGIEPSYQRGIRRHLLSLQQEARSLNYESKRHEKSYSRNPGLTDTRFRPLARRRDITFLPPWVFMRVRKPCFLLRLRRLGWNVRLGMKDRYSWFRRQC